MTYNHTRSYVAERKLHWRAIGIRCLREGNLAGFRRAYAIARSIRSPEKEYAL